MTVFMTKENILEVRELDIGYEDKILIQKINFSVQEGEIFMILGESGSGKSTLLRYMIGLENCKTGKIMINNHEISCRSTKKHREIFKFFGVMYQSGALFSGLTLLENVRLPMEEYTHLSLEEMNELALQKLYLVELAEYAHYYPAEISGGMKKRVGIARAMALGPKLLFLDEPSSGLDPITSAEIDWLIKKLSRLLNITFVIVSHDLASILDIGDKVIILDKASRSIIAQGNPKALREQSTVPFVQKLLNRKHDNEEIH
jgi:phospholipid/cholesterol/gamma-HCH transport system ATP-binding protein